jgi:uncharacterized protein YjbI with pentapeptide repeats
MADFTRANLASARLTGANLGGADLTSAYLLVARLTSANFGGAYRTAAALYGADLGDLLHACKNGSPLPDKDEIAARVRAGVPATVPTSTGEYFVQWLAGRRGIAEKQSAATATTSTSI